MLDKNQQKRNKRARRHGRVRSRVFGTAERPRLSVFRSNKHIVLQLIDDKKDNTIVSVSDLKTKAKDNKVDSSKKVGAELAKLAAEKKIKNVVFDRGGYKFHGRVKAAAEGAREGGLDF